MEPERHEPRLLNRPLKHTSEIPRLKGKDVMDVRQRVCLQLLANALEQLVLARQHADQWGEWGRP